MFGKDKDADGKGAKPVTEEVAPPLKPFSRKASVTTTKPSATPLRADIPRRVVEIPGAQRRTERMGMSLDDEANRLTVGRNICLSGEITACQKLVVEGQVEAGLKDAAVIEVAPTGLYRGTAEVDEADISGRFEGTLIARQKLTIRKGGRIDGSVRYGRIVIESGGEISGDMAALEDEAKEPPVGAGTLER